MDADYEHPILRNHDYPLGTACHVGDEYGEFVIEPSATGKHTAVSMAVKGHSPGIKVDLDRAELKVLIAELQRAESDLFFDKYPRDRETAVRNPDYPAYHCGTPGCRICEPEVVDAEIVDDEDFPLGPEASIGVRDNVVVNVFFTGNDLNVDEVTKRVKNVVGELIPA